MTCEVLVLVSKTPALKATVGGYSLSIFADPTEEGIASGILEAFNNKFDLNNWDFSKRISDTKHSFHGKIKKCMKKVLV